MSERIPVAVLAATGSVGQRFVQLLDNHPQFEVVALTGSERREGQTYAQACRWILPEPMPAWAGRMPVLPFEGSTAVWQDAGFHAFVCRDGRSASRWAVRCGRTVTARRAGGVGGRQAGRVPSEPDPPHRTARGARSAPRSSPGASSGCCRSRSCGFRRAAISLLRSTGGASHGSSRTCGSGGRTRR